MSEESANAATVSRIIFFDTLRGFTIVSMVLFHACYDAAYLYGYSLPWFTGSPIQDIWRASISWTFLLLAGWMTHFSRSNARRGVIYGVAALAVFLATSIVSVDTAISFGILFCMAASTLIYAAIQPLLSRCKYPLILAVIALILFFITYSLPHARSEVEGLAWLGFPSMSFSSGDYYPLMPYTFIYLAGACLSQAFHAGKTISYPSWMKRDHLPVLTFLGRKSLFIYLVHQPLLLLVFSLIPS